MLFRAFFAALFAPIPTPMLTAISKKHQLALLAGADRLRPLGMRFSLADGTESDVVYVCQVETHEMGSIYRSARCPALGKVEAATLVAGFGEFLAEYRLPIIIEENSIVSLELRVDEPLVEWGSGVELR